MTSDTARRYARLGGFLLLLSILAGGFGEMYVPARLVVPGDAAATAHRIGTSMPLFRLAFAGYLVEALCDVALSLVFYVLLRPVDEALSLLAAFFGLVATAVFAASELFFFCASLVLEPSPWLAAFTPAQRDALAMLSLKAYGTGAGVLMGFGGVGAVVLGILVVRSGYLPKLPGALWAAGGAGFVARGFLLVLAPRLASDALLLPTLLGMLSLGVLMLARGVDVAGWEARALSRRAS